MRVTISLLLGFCLFGTSMGRAQEDALRHVVDQDATILDHTGRPQHLLPFGAPIRELG